MFRALKKIEALKWWLSFIPLLPLLLLLLSHQSDRYELYPGEVGINALSVYTDSANGGASQIIPTDDIRALTYELHDTKEFFIPFVGYSLRLKDTVGKVALTSFDRVELSIDVDHRQTCYILFNMYVEKGAPYDTLKEVSLSCELPLFPEDSTYTLNLDEFYFPDWWLYENKLDDDDIDRSYLKRIRSINIHLGAQDNNYANEVFFHSMSLVKEKKFYYLWLGIATFLWFLLLYIIHSLVKQHREQLEQREKIVVPYKTLDTLTHSIEDLRRLVHYIGTHYTEEGLSITDVADKCEIETSWVSELLATHFQEVTFKQYLNMIRVYEAKRLLVESEMNISEIGFAVGFSNVTHFNRTFKKILETTPSALRKSAQAGRGAC